MEELNVVIAGAAGEGVQTVGEVLSEAIAGHGYAVFAWQEFESRIRGGQNSYSIRISEKPVNAPAMRADILLALNDGASVKYGPLIQTDGVLIAEKKIRDRMIAIAFFRPAPLRAISCSPSTPDTANFPNWCWRPPMQKTSSDKPCAPSIWPTGTRCRPLCSPISSCWILSFQWKTFDWNNMRPNSIWRTHPLSTITIAIR